MARRALGYQDHVAVAVCAEMLATGDVSEVWCELLDDLTLLIADGSETVVEHVQVKDHRSVLWGATRITARAGGRAGTSVVERSLSHDRCREPCRFRIISSADVDPQIRLLTYPRGHQDRAPGLPEMQALVTAVSTRLPGAASPNGRGVDYWVSATLWEVRGSEAAVTDRALLLVGRLAHDIFNLAAPDHHQAIYDHVLTIAHSAAKADPRLEPERKKARPRPDGP